MGNGSQSVIEIHNTIGHVVHPTYRNVVASYVHLFWQYSIGRDENSRGARKRFAGWGSVHGPSRPVRVYGVDSNLQCKQRYRVEVTWCSSVGVRHRRAVVAQEQRVNGGTCFSDISDFIFGIFSDLSENEAPPRFTEGCF